MTSETKILIGIGTGITLLFGIFIGIAQQQRQPEKTSTGKDIQESLVRPDSHGSASTPTRVTITEFGDYQCPACGTAHPLVKEMLKEYAGKVTLVFRHFPLGMHPNARTAAKAAEASALQGKFWEMHDMIYEHQSEWSEQKDPMLVFLGYAKTLGLNVEQFSKDSTSGSVADRVIRDLKDGIAVGVDATPTFFINSEKHVGLPSKEFKDLLDKALKE